MAGKQLPKIDDEPGADERFERAVRNALATPPKPKAARKPEPSPAKVR